MPRFSVTFPFAFAVLALTACLAACVPALAVIPPQPVATAAPTVSMPPQKSWILVNLPPDASQLEYGAEIWRLVCSACHGDRGQGLTDQWRATWAPEDRNCWQSKCHGSNHPPDGFVLPVAPAVVGAAAISPFATAQDLHDFVQSYMPWQNPRSLTSKDSWAVTAYILKLNRMNPGPELSAITAADIRLRAEAALPPPAVTPAASSNGPDQLIYGWMLGGAVLVILVAFIAVRASRKKNRSGPGAN